MSVLRALLCILIIAAVQDQHVIDIAVCDWIALWQLLFPMTKDLGRWSHCILDALSQP